MASTRIVVMSDSHGDREIVKNIKERYLGKVDAIFHNGDSELPSSDPIWEGIHVVAGNCDYDSGYPNSLVVHLPNATIAQTHGHLYHINFMWDRLDLFVVTCVIVNFDTISGYLYQSIEFFVDFSTRL